MIPLSLLDVFPGLKKELGLERKRKYEGLESAEHEHWREETDGISSGKGSICGMEFNASGREHVVWRLTYQRPTVH